MNIYTFACKVIVFLLTKFRQHRMYFTNPDTDRLYREGEIMKMECYARVLRYLCTLGPDDFYFGLVANNILDDLQELSE